MKKILLTITFLALGCSLKADRDQGPRDARVIASDDGAYFLLTSRVSERSQSCLWTVYSVGLDGIFKEFWSGDGIDSRDIYLADDGNHIVCVESWPTGSMGKEDIVIAVYTQGRLLKAYRTVDLVGDVSRIRRSVSHYRWLAEGTFVHSNGGTMFFTTVDGKDFTLDMITGKLNWSLK